VIRKEAMIGYGGLAPPVQARSGCRYIRRAGD
jgi:hypothetical protein